MVGTTVYGWGEGPASSRAVRATHPLTFYLINTPNTTFESGRQLFSEKLAATPQSLTLFPALTKDLFVLLNRLIIS